MVLEVYATTNPEPNREEVSRLFDRRPARLGDVEDFPSVARESMNRDIYLTEDEPMTNQRKSSMSCR